MGTFFAREEARTSDEAVVSLSDSRAMKVLSRAHSQA